MLLHYGIEIVKKQPKKNNFEGFKNVNFDIIETNSQKKYSYAVLGNECTHYDIPIDLQDVIDGYNSQNHSYTCNLCQTTYNEISDFYPHNIHQQASEQFHPDVEKITVLNGILVSHVKRNEAKKVLQEDNILFLIKKLFQQNPQQDCQIDSILSNENITQTQFQLLCLLDNINIIIPVRHQSCRHLSCYELSSLILYQLDKKQNYGDYLECQHNGCKSKIPMKSMEKMFSELVLDSQLLECIKKAYPGNQIYIANKKEDGKYQIRDYISANLNTNRDNFCVKYWESVERGQNEEMRLSKYTTLEDFQKSVLQKMAIVMNAQLHKQTKEKIDSYKYQGYQLQLLDRSGSKVEFPSRCFKCPIETQDSRSDTNIPTSDLRTLIAYMLHHQIYARKNNLKNHKLKCLLCQNEFTKTTIQLNFGNDQLYYDAWLYRIIQEQRIDSDGRFQYKGEEYLKKQFKTKLNYSMINLINDPPKNNNNIWKLQFKSIKCPILGSILNDPLINFQCKNQTRVSFSGLIQRLKLINFNVSEKTSLKLCNCNDSEECSSVTKIEGQLYLDEILINSISKRNIALDYTYGMEVQIIKENNIFKYEVTELKQNQYVLVKLSPPPIRTVLVDEEEAQQIIQQNFVDNSIPQQVQ